MRTDRDYLHYFFHIVTKGNNKGKISGFPLGGKCVINRDIKIKAINEFYKSVNEEYIQFVGIASDELERLERLKGTSKVSLLAKYGYTEAMAYNLCKKFGLLSPIYSFTKRGGCWFCPSASIGEYAHMKLNHPELWVELRKLSLTDNLVSYGFKYGKTFDEVDKKVDVYLSSHRL